MPPSCCYTIETREGRGHCLVTTMDLVPGQLILTEKPLVLSPPTRTKAQCLQCAKIVTGDFHCSRCNFPMCNIQCEEGPQHKGECDLFSKVNFEADIEDVTVRDDHYAAILPIRCLLLKNDPQQWKAFSSLLSHCDQRKTNSTLWSFHQEHSVEMLRDLCEMSGEVTDEEIHRVIGIFYINSLEVDLPPGYGEEMGFYPMFSNINHSCIANSRVVKLPSKALEA